MKLNSIIIFCENVKVLRRQSGLNKKDFAKKINISVYSLNKIENGIIPERMPCDILADISNEFGVDPYILLCCQITDQHD